MTERVENLDGAADNLKNLILKQQLFGIRVHSWLRAKPQHFDRGRDFDVLVAHYEI